MPTAAPPYGATCPARRGGWPRRLAALLLVPLLSFALVVTMPTSAGAAPALTILPALGVGVPLSVVSAGVGGGVSLVSAGAGMAGAAITSAAALAGNWAVNALFTWSPNAPSNFGDPPPAPSGTLAGSAQCFTPSNPSGCPHPVHGTAYSYLVGSVQYGASGTGQYDIKYQYQDNATGVVTTQGGSSSPTGGYITLRHPAGTTMLGFSFAEPGTTTPTAGGGTLAPSGGGTGSGGEAGTTPLTYTPTTHWMQPDGSVGSTVGTSCTMTRGDTAGCVGRFPAAPAGATVTGRSAPITQPDGTQVGDGLTPDPDGSTTPVVTPAPVIPDAWSDCQDRTCVMTLTQTDPAGNVQTCGPNNACASYAQVVAQWPATGTTAATLPRTAPDGMTYQCKYGPYAVAVAECQVIPGVGMEPGTGTDAGNCLGGVGWNPTTWVTVPVKCALEWAFVPSSAPLAQAQVTAAQLGQAAPFAYVTGTVGWVDSLDSSTQCFSLDLARAEGAVRVLSTCEPGPFVQWLQANRGLMEAALYASFFIPMAWWAWRQYAPGSQGVA